MSYFIVGFKTEAIINNAFEKIFANIVPTHIKNDTLRMQSRSSSLVMYGNRK